MWKKWKNKNVDLSLLIEGIMHFFKQKNFSIRTISRKGEYKIIAFPKHFHDLTEEIKITVSGRPNDFKVIFDAGSHSRTLVLLSNILTPFGGGVFVRRGLKNLEELEKLEREFWIYTERIIWKLIDSARNS